MYYENPLSRFPTRREQRYAYDRYYNARELLHVAEEALQADPEDEDLLHEVDYAIQGLEVARANYLGTLHLPPEVYDAVAHLCGGHFG